MRQDNIYEYVHEELSSLISIIESEPELKLCGRIVEMAKIEIKEKIFIRQKMFEKVQGFPEPSE